ncbi:hypothetical protein [Metallosphaera javensis (ex Sakai et al. 2022)]|uniref:hypothetical protein n=1 Tax=Metallosphaera javensis (ex Sakai et al. 2022) TaxID=2775498 RepID=UPI002588295E|nr:MAG: hypothetical protein MjAS7_1656 [Metallosphaera javensis (ex Sakai et al. 2022)]
MQEIYSNGESLNLTGVREAFNFVPQAQGTLHQHEIANPVVDNKYGIIIRLSTNEPFNVESHEAFVMVFRDREGKIVSVDIEYEGVDDDPSDK